MLVIAIWMGAAISKNDVLFYNVNVFFIQITGLLLINGLFILNNVNDVNIDRISHPKRIILLNYISTKGAKKIAFFSLSLAIIFNLSQYLITSNLFLLIFFFIALTVGLSYEIILKKNGLPGNMSVAILIGTSILYGGSIGGNKPLTLLLFFMAFLINLSREIIKDIDDFKGDFRERNSFPKTFSINIARRASISIIFISVIISSFPILILGVNTGYLIFISLADLILIISIIFIDNNVPITHLLLKLGMILSFPGFLFLI